MSLQIDTSAIETIDADWIIVGMNEDCSLCSRMKNLDNLLGGLLGRLKENKDLSGKLADVHKIYDLPNFAAKRMLIIGLGQSEDVTRARLQKAYRTAARVVSEKESVTVAILSSGDYGDLTVSQFAEAASIAMTVGCVGQDLFQQEPKHHPLEKVTFVLNKDIDQQSFQEAVTRGEILGESTNLTRELVNLPAADIYPESFAKRAQKAAEEFGFECTVLDEKELAKEKMNSLLAVAQGSDRPARVVSLSYCGAGKGAPVLALVGKGVTFDSGGLSLKPTDGMKTMKCDMAGAATVLGAISAIARLKLPVNVSGYLGLVENMISGNSYKLGDVVTARNGVTIEVLNTDAEGRLVLADILCLAVDQGASHLVDLATLTGACVVALGEEITGAFTNHQAWCDQLLKSAKSADELVWQMPTYDFFAELLSSDLADCKNVGARWGGSITAAKFLEKFVGETPWVHLDIAGPSFASSNKPHREGGATGCMLQTLVELAECYKECQAESLA